MDLGLVVAFPQMVLIAAAIILLLLLDLAWIAFRRRSSRRLRRQFGPEYEQTVRDTGSKRAAHEELENRLKRHDEFEIRPLPAEARDRYLSVWKQTQTRFVDAPSEALRQADMLVAEVMRARGYPVDNFEQRAADVSVDHPHVVRDYREAHRISLANEENRASTEDLRQALVHYRSLFNELLSQEGAPRTTEQAVT